MGLEVVAPFVDLASNKDLVFCEDPLGDKPLTELEERVTGFEVELSAR